MTMWIYFYKEPVVMSFNGWGGGGGQNGDNISMSANQTY